MSQVKLTYGGNDYVIYCNQVIVGWRGLNTAKPRANGMQVVEVQTQGFENPTYVLQGVHLINEGLASSGDMTYANLLAMAKNQYTGSNTITFTFTFSNSGTTETLVGSNGTSPIKVVIDSFSFPIDATSRYSDGSNQYYIPVGTITLRETA
jgi:hypothetical protein